MRLSAHFPCSPLPRLCEDNVRIYLKMQNKKREKVFKYLKKFLLQSSAEQQHYSLSSRNMKFVPDDAGEWAGFLQAPAVKFAVMPCTVLVPGLRETGAARREVKLKSFWEMSSVRESFSKKIVFVNCRLLAVAEAEGRRRHAAPHTHQQLINITSPLLVSLFVCYFA